MGTETGTHRPTYGELGRGYKVLVFLGWVAILPTFLLTVIGVILVLTVLGVGL